MSKNKSLPDSLAIDMTEILDDEIVKQNFQKIDPAMRIALGGSYNPILAKFESLCEDPKNDTTKNRKELSEDIRAYIKNKDPNNKISTDINKSYENGAEGRLYFILQGIENNKSFMDIMSGYTHSEQYRPGVQQHFEDIFFTDFNRIHPKVIDQNGKEIFANLHGDILDELGEENYTFTKYKEKLKEKLNLSDKELQLYISRVHQYSAAGTGLSFKPTEMPLSELRRENIIHINTDSDGKIKFESFEHKYTTSKLKMTDGIIIDEAIKTPYYEMSNIVSISPSDKTFNKSSSLPTQKLNETITYKPIDSEAHYNLSEHLKHRELDKVFERALSDNNKEKIDHIIHTLPNLEDKIQDKLITALVKSEIQRTEGTPNREDKIQKNIVQKLIPNSEATATSPELNNKIRIYLKHKDPNDLTKIIQTVKAICKSAWKGKFISRKEYQTTRLKDEMDNIKKTLRRSYANIGTKSTLAHNTKKERSHSH